MHGTRNLLPISYEDSGPAPGSPGVNSHATLPVL